MGLEAFNYKRGLLIGIHSSLLSGDLSDKTSALLRPESVDFDTINQSERKALALSPIFCLLVLRSIAALHR